MRQARQRDERSQLVHDIRQGLNVIGLTCDNLRERLEQPLNDTSPAEIARRLEKVDGQVRQVSQLLTTLENLL